MSYYGMRALLVYYMTKHLGFSQSQSSIIYGLYTAAVWLAPLPGGVLGDRYLGQHRSILVGGSLMALGHFLMSFESLLFPALGAIAIGNGLFKPNISTQVGDLYAPDDPRRDRGYSVYYFGVSVGSFIAPVVCGTVGERYGWHWGFGLAGLGMLAGLTTYHFGRRFLPPDRLTVSARHTADPQASTALDRSKVLALIALSLSATFFWAAFEQQGNTLALWADTYTQRRIVGGSWDFLIPATWFQSLNGLFIIALTPALISLWRFQGAKNREPPSSNKVVIGALWGAAGCLVMVVAALVEEKTGPVSCLWLTLYFLTATVGELYLSPTCLSLFNKAAPLHLASTMVGVWYLSLFLGSYLAGVVGSYWSELSKPLFFTVLALLNLISGLALYVTTRSFSRSLGCEDTIDSRRSRPVAKSSVIR